MSGVTPYPHAAPARIPQEDQARKDAPMYRGLLGYFPAALFEVAAHSLASDRKHNGDVPGGPRWARQKSTDHEDTIIRHLIDAGRPRFRGPDGRFVPATEGRRYHLRCLAWRALALLQEDCEAEGAEPGVSSVFPNTLDQIREKHGLGHPGADEVFDRLQELREQQRERWGVFRIAYDGTSYRSSDLPGVYGSKAEADEKIRELDRRFPLLEVRRFSARLGEGEE